MYKTEDLKKVLKVLEENNVTEFNINVMSGGTFKRDVPNLTSIIPESNELSEIKLTPSLTKGENDEITNKVIVIKEETL